MSAASGAPIVLVQNAHGTHTLAEASSLSLTAVDLSSLTVSSVTATNATINSLALTAINVNSVTATTLTVTAINGSGSGGDTIPPGTITMFGSSAIPTGWLACSGSYELTSAYADLYAAIGNTYNDAGDSDPTRFRLPNLRAKFPIGIGTPGGGFTERELAASGGAESHSHTIAGSDFVDTIAVDSGAGNNAVDADGGTEAPTSSASQMPPFLALNFIIKT